ncbi:MAG: hypothetical protein B6242_11565 [Anaerolineaceae bacterium 4572_78]|nr:MAG: hypothetical protein B6242_11565 [Anaerolineaceae bacterium 4572_78]
MQSHFRTIVLLLSILFVGLFYLPPTVHATGICDSVTEIPLAECQALEAVYNSTGGDSWTTNTDWMQTNTPCSWFGVECGSGHVTELSLNYNRLVGSLPSEIDNLANLQILYVHHNLSQCFFQ